MPTLADKGYIGAGAGIHVPIKGRHLAADNRTRNRLLNALRAPAERANALLKSTWKVSIPWNRRDEILSDRLLLCRWLGTERDRGEPPS